MNIQQEQEVLVFPREYIAEHQRFVPWNHANSLVRSLEQSMEWIQRDQAEVSSYWVQPIPCGLVLNQRHEYCLLRRIQTARSDLRDRISLLFGGHIDQRPTSATASLATIFEMTLVRELYEELSIMPDHIASQKPIGLAIDAQDDVAVSRHVAFLYEIVIDQPVRPRAYEEFNRRSKLNGKFCTPTELLHFRSGLDPWSTIVFDSYIAPSNFTVQTSLFPMLRPAEVLRGHRKDSNNES